MPTPRIAFRKRLVRALLVAAAALSALSACGGDESTQPTENAEPGAAAATLGVQESEYSITLSSASPEGGPTTFVVENAGTIDHALKIEGPGGEVETALIAPGASAELTVDLVDGAYELYCPVTGHREQGMELDLQVGEAPPATTQPAQTQPSGGYDY